MLFFMKFLPENHNPKKKKVNAATNGWMVFNIPPGLFHFPAPVNVIKNKHRIIMHFR